MDDKKWLIFDCRFDLSDVTKGQVLYQLSHIPGALYAHLDHHLSSPVKPHTGRHPMPQTEQLIEWLQGCGMHESKQVVVYDDSFGAMAARLWWLLKCLGHRSVAVLDGGWQAWNEAGYEVDDKPVQTIKSDFGATLDQDCIVGTKQILANLKQAEFSLVDVRSAERFNGIMEPIDPVAGHIPGAINIPLTQNMDEKGCFKSPQLLRELYAEVTAKYSTHSQVYMCGSGVTACHSLLALAVAGYDMPRVYAGSWSEWIRDPHRPVATR
jgi:thiosulfate/3-mercaptopyruvate sulfurtransferase